MISRIIAVSGLLLLSITLRAPAQEIITITTRENALVLQTNDEQDLTILYFGKKLLNDSEYPGISDTYHQGDDYTTIYNSAYTPAGSKNLLEPAIDVTHPDGNESLSLKYVDHNATKVDANVTETQVHLKDSVYGLDVTLYYTAFHEENVIEAWTEITNHESDSITLHKYASVNLYFQGYPEYWLHQFHGDWAMEMQPEATQLTHGIKVLDSKLGTRANLFQPAVFILGLGSPTSEDQGTLFMGGLEWSGNFRTDLELDPTNNVRLVSGINNYKSDYTLSQEQSFQTPKFWFTLSHQGQGKASRDVHDWARKYKILDGEGERLTLLNNWEATYFDFDEAKLKKLIGDAKKLGVDMFLLDDGWFGNNHPRNLDNAGLGDWQANTQKLPNGISTLVKTAEENEVKFGIWIEPEMVNPESDLYNEHPEWVIKQPERPEHYFRNQLVLDLSNPKVQDFVLGVVDDLFTENPNLAYIKWDCNAVIYNAYSSFEGDQQTHLYVDYVKGLYSVLEKIRAKYPEVPMMLCSGGGGRVDYGAMKYFTEFWPSDNTDPLERIFMQWNYSFFILPSQLRRTLPTGVINP